MYTYFKPSDDKGPVFTGYMVDEASTIKSFDYNSIYRSKAFNEAMKYFDTADDMTRNILLSVNEADQNFVMKSLSNRLYKHIVDKIDDIDFGTIPTSRGDITKIDNYDNLVDCINILSEILQASNQSTESIEVVSLALQNMIDRVDLFSKAYKLNVEMPIIIYNTIANAIVCSVSYLISAYIEFIKLPDNNGFEIAISNVKNTHDNLLFNDLKKFNNICGNGDFDRAMDFVMKQNANNFMGASVAFGASSIAAMFGILLLIIPIIRELIFFFYYSRSKASEYFEAQSALLTMNAYNIENNLSREDKSKKEIAKKQKSIADTFKKIANALKVDIKTAEQKTSKDISKLDKEKYKHSDVMDTIPDSSNSVLF